MSLTPNEKDLLAKKSDLEGILKPDANDILHLPDITISLAENQQGYTTSGLSKDGLVFAGGGTITGITSSSGNSTTLAASQSMVSAKQDQLTAGTNITIQNNVISATGGGSNVTVTPIQNEGKQVATISVDGTSSTLYSGKTVYTGTTVPSASLGANDDLYIKYEGQGTTSFEDLTLTANTANQVPITNFSNYLTISFRLTSTSWSGYADVEEDIADIPTYPSTITVFEYNVFNNVALSKYDNGIYIHLNGGMPNTVTQFIGSYTSYEPTNEYIKINNKWQEISIGGGGASALTNLTDVDITTPTDGQGLVYNNSTQKWENNNISVSSLSDINLTNLANGQILKYDSANQQWINANESGGGGGSFTETSLFTGGTSGIRTFTLSSAFTNYDYIAIYYSHNDGQTTYQDIRLYPSSLLYSLIGTSVNILGIANDAWYYYFTVTSTTQLDYAKSNAGWITDVIGIKYGGGGGSTTTVSVTPKVLTGINIADITVGNGNTTDIYDYAYFDGSGYYETPFKVDTDHEYEITFEANYDTTMAVIGTYTGANYFHLTIYNNYWYVGTNSGEVNPSAYTTGKHTFKTDSSHTYLDDTQFTSYTPAVVNNYITIGARENTYLYKGKIYEFKIKSISTGNVLYDLVPGMRGTTKGLYDLVSDTFVECSFITNMGTKTGTSGGVTTQLYAPSIEANPSGTATDSLSSIEIDGTIYNIEGGGGSGGNPELEETALLTTPITAEGTYTLLDNIEDYDFVSFVSGVSYEADIRLLAVSDMLNMLDNNLIINCAGTAGRWFNITALSGTSITITKYSGTIIQSIMGYKIKGGGGGGDASPNITLLNDGTITDGQYVLSEPISNFDEINFIIQYRNEYINSKNYYPKDLLRLSSSSTNPYGVTNFLIEDYGQRYLYCQYIDETHIKPLEIFSVLKGIYGIKYKGGSGGSASAEELTSAEYEELTPAEKENGTIYFINDPSPRVKNPTQLIERVSAADSHITSSSYSTSWGSFEDWKAFNNVSPNNLRDPQGNCWQGKQGYTNQWIQYQFDTPKYLTQIDLLCFSNYSGDWVGTVNIEGSNDGNNFTNILETGQTYTLTAKIGPVEQGGDGTETHVTIPLDYSEKWTYIRLTFVESMCNNGTPSCYIDEIYVYGGTELESSTKICYMDTSYADNSSNKPTNIITYSTAEQEIGTWVDGSPLYQKTIYTSSMSNHSNIIIDSSLTTNNVDYFIGNELSYIVNNSYRGNGFQVEIALTNNGVMLDNNNAPVGITSLSEIYATVRYTKQAPKNITLLHFDNDLTDSCGTIWNIRNTAPVISTDQAKFGTSSLKFGGNGYIYSDVMTKFKFDANDFTIDAWIYPTSTGRQAFFSMAPINGGDYRMGVDMFYRGSSANQWFSTTGSSWNPIGSDDSTGRGTIALSTGVWQHVALVRNGTRLITFIDGQIAKENTISASASIYWGGADTLRLGSWGTGGQNGEYLYSGYMDEFRVANYAAWTAAFTPPTEPYS